jgi:hypothetical protein
MPHVKNRERLAALRTCGVVLFQAKAPSPLYAAVREQLKADNVSLRRFLRWAMLEYLHLRNPKVAEATLKQCI